jgi:hypothetical protein
MKFTNEIFDKPDTVVNLAQAAFDKWLSEQQVVYAFHDEPFGRHNWGLMEKFPNKNPTHSAYVVCIEPLAPKVCEHPNDEICFSDVRGQWVCGKCTKTLQPNWSEV